MNFRKRIYLENGGKILEANGYNLSELERLIKWVLEEKEETPCGFQIEKTGTWNDKTEDEL
jgi:hypothetical protein